MKKVIYKIAILFVAVSLVSCEKGLMNFDNKLADVYFSDAGRSINALAFDSLYVSFSYSKSQDSIRDVIVAVTGSPVDHDRAYKAVINPLSTAISGTHFEALPQNFIISKNKLSDTIKLKLLRTPEMQTNSYFVIIDLVSNENFGTNLSTRLIAGKPLKTISTKILFNDIVRKPKLWIDSYWGVFTRKKLFYVCDFLEITPEYMDAGMSVAENSALPKIVQRHLNTLKAAGKTVYEDDNTEMKMGPSAQ